MESFTSKISFLKRAFGSVSIARDSVNVAVRCPVCSENSEKKKFSINTDNWSCHCWVCGVKGRTPYRILKDNVCQEMALEFQQRFSNDKSSIKNINEDIEDIVELPSGFLPLFLKKNVFDPDIKSCISYLRSRGLTQKDLWYFKLCTATTGRFRRRIIIPSFDTDGDLNYFSARSIDKDVFPKYLNSKNKKTDIIFNEINIDWKNELTIVEGPFDLFKCNQNSTCLLGSNLSGNSFLFKRIIANKTPILIALDSDMRKKSIKIAETLLSYDCEVRVLNLEHFHDVGEMSKKEFIIAANKAQRWSRNLSLMEKISSISTGSLV